jgi:hypothetical protein
MKVSIDELVKLNFKLTHEWIRDGEFIKAQALSGEKLTKSMEPMVYAWVSPEDEGLKQYRLLYIGKAGGGVSKRLREHEGGFKNSGTGKKNFELIQGVLKSDKPVHIYSRVSDQVNILGQKVSLYSAEEEALCDRFSPEWNRAQFAAGTKVGKKRTTSKPRKTQVEEVSAGEIDFSALPRGNEVVDFMNSLGNKERNQLAQLLAWAFRIEGKLELEQKIVFGYTGQPTGCNGVPMLVFANFGKGGKAKKDSWKIRIPLQRTDKQGLTVVLPKAYMSKSLGEKFVEAGKEDNFRPLAIEDFLKKPSKYVKF